MKIYGLPIKGMYKVLEKITRRRVNQKRVMTNIEVGDCDDMSGGLETTEIKI